MAFFNFPFHVTKDKPAIAAEVQTNFDTLLLWVMDNLVQKDGSVAMTGPLTLAPGDPVSPEHAANKAYSDKTIPVGVIWEYGGTSLPDRWLWCDGSTYTVTQHQQLADAIGRNFTAPAIPGTSFQVPDKRKRVSVGFDATDQAFAMGKTNALTQRDWEVPSHFHLIPEHGHALSGATGNDREQHAHTWSGSVGPDGAHGHPSNGGHTDVMFRDSQYFTGYHGPPVGAGGLPGGVAITWGPLAFGEHSHGVSGTVGNITVNHTHAIGTLAVANQLAFNTNPTGTGTTLTDRNYPPYVTVNYIIYAGTA